MTELNDANADLAAIEAAIDEWKSGDDGLPVNEAFAEIRRDEQQASQAGRVRWLPGLRNTSETNS
jgi:hypothetical protein